MPEDVDRRYRELVRLAYLVLPGRRKRVYRLAIAQRIVDESLPRWPARNSGRAYSRARTRVLRRAITPSWRLRVLLGPWLRGLPARLPDPALTVALARLDPAARAAYVLLRVESLPRHVVRDQLVVAGVKDARAALEAADAVLEVTPPTLDPSLRPALRRRTRTPVAVATALTVLLVGGFQLTRSGETAPTTRPAGADRPRVTMAAADAWMTGPHSLAVWPARGGMVHDTAFVGRALAAWTRWLPSVRDPRLLFAGKAGDTAVAVLWSGDRIGRYTEGEGVFEVFPAGAAATPLALAGDRYLVPPWTTKVTRAVSARKVKVHDGVTEPVRVTADCRRGPLLRLRQPDGTKTVADLGGPVLTEVGYRTPVGSEGATADGARLWGRLACAVPPPDRPAAAATALEFWTGRLPGGERARWVCTRYSFPDGTVTRHATLLTGSDDGRPTGDCGPADQPVSGTWWRSRGRWHYVAAAGKGLVPRAEGTGERTVLRKGLLVARYKRSKQPPERAVVLTARPGG